MENTPRKSFTKLQKLKMFESQKGLCGICGGKIQAGDKTIVEHMRALALGGTNETGNVCVVHMECASIKTQKEDNPRIRKAKRAKASIFGFKDDGQAKIHNRGFAPSGRSKRSVCDTSLKIMPRRQMFEDMQ